MRSSIGFCQNCVNRFIYNVQQREKSKSFGAMIQDKNNVEDMIKRIY